MEYKAIGLEDYHLSDNPKTNFIKPNFERNYNYSKKHLEINPNENIKFGKTFYFEIPKQGHFIHNIFFHFRLPKLEKVDGTYASWTNNIAYALVKNVSLEIGGVEVDSFNGTFLDIEDELNNVIGATSGIDLLTGKFVILQSLIENATKEREYILPLKFWFNKDISNSLPVSLLKYQNMKIKIEIRNFEDCITYDGNIPPNKSELLDGYLSCEYINLEKEVFDEFKNLTKKKEGLNYVVEQTSMLKVDVIPPNISNFKTDLNFSHPVKDLKWVIIEKDSIENNDWFNYSKRDDNTAPMVKAKISIDGVDQTPDYTNEIFFRLLEPKKYYNNIPQKYINVYSFSRKPNELDYSGSLNFSCITNGVLHLKMSENNKESFLYVFAKNYNIFNISNGQGIMKY